MAIATHANDLLQAVITAGEEQEPLAPNAFETVLSVALFGTMAVFIAIAIYLVVRSMRKPLPREKSGQE